MGEIKFKCVLYLLVEFILISISAVTLKTVNQLKVYIKARII